MKKITPDPPPIDLSLKFQVPLGTTLAAAIINSQVCIQDVLLNACQYFLLSYNSVQKAYWECPEGELKHTLANSMQSLEIAWGQVDALVTALNNAPPPDRPGFRFCGPLAAAEPV
jgi:hypothetical protein